MICHIQSTARLKSVSGNKILDPCWLDLHYNFNRMMTNPVKAPSILLSLCGFQVKMSTDRNVDNQHVDKPKRRQPTRRQPTRRQTETSTNKTSTNRNVDNQHVDRPKRRQPTRRQTETSTTNTSTNRNVDKQHVDKPKRRQTTRHVNKPKSRQTTRRQTETSTNQNMVCSLLWFIAVWWQSILCLVYRAAIKLAVGQRIDLLPSRSPWQWKPRVMMPT